MTTAPQLLVIRERAKTHREFLWALPRLRIVKGESQRVSAVGLPKGWLPSVLIALLRKRKKSPPLLTVLYERRSQGCHFVLQLLS